MEENGRTDIEILSYTLFSIPFSSFTYILLNRVHDRTMTTIVVSIPMTVAMPMIVALAS